MIVLFVYVRGSFHNAFFFLFSSVGIYFFFAFVRVSLLSFTAALFPPDFPDSIVFFLFIMFVVLFILLSLFSNLIIYSLFSHFFPHLPFLSFTRIFSLHISPISVLFSLPQLLHPRQFDPIPAYISMSYFPKLHNLIQFFFSQPTFFVMDLPLSSTCKHTLPCSAVPFPTKHLFLSPLKRRASPRPSTLQAPFCIHPLFFSAPRL